MQACASKYQWQTLVYNQKNPDFSSNLIQKSERLATENCKFRYCRPVSGNRCAAALWGAARMSRGAARLFNKAFFCFRTKKFFTRMFDVCLKDKF